MFLYDEKGQPYRVVTKTYQTFEEVSDSYKTDVELQQQYRENREKRQEYWGRVAAINEDIKKGQDSIEKIKCGRIPDETFCGHLPEDKQEQMEVLLEKVEHLKKEKKSIEYWIDHTYGELQEEIQRNSSFWEETAWGWVYKGPAELR